MKKLIIALFVLTLMQLSLLQTKSYSQDKVLKAGIARLDITPTENLFMGGYDESCRSGPSNGVFGSIYIRALVFDDNTSRVVFVETDIVSLPPAEYLTVRNLISAETGIPSDNIMLGCVHNHAAPYPGEKNKNSDWSRQLHERFATVVKSAVADLEPVRIGGGTGRSNIAMNRRKVLTDTVSYLTFDENNSSQSYGKHKTNKPVMIREMAGVSRLGNNPMGPIDDEVGILRIDRISGQPKAILINYACHGTSLGCRNNKISPEWNGHMLEYLEKEIPGVIGIFVQGASGDINPRFVGGLDGYRDDLEKTRELGYEIGQEVFRVFSGIKTYEPSDPVIKTIHTNITCPRKYASVVADFRNTTIDIPVTAIKIDQFIWVTFPGELFHEIGQNIKAMTHSRFPFIAGYCNGSIGYLPTQKAHSEGGYEPWSTPFDPVTEKIFLKGVEEMLPALY
ncbi:MAG: neutral/alkaline non-lysosomal ceramidase N-terminal domain-containing protein [Bacteroidales bacterium]|jgi:hypothetical protein|nr:neutral/alkaline non-lysosomal ceramidase N-terminal domain-containing protein [Bacteroidales bacterium]